MKETTKMSKKELCKVLGANALVVKEADNTLYEQMGYTSKMLKKDATKVTKADLIDLVNQVIKSLGDKFVMPAFAEEDAKTVEPKVEEVKADEQPKTEVKVENSEKPKTKIKGKGKKSEKVEEPKTEEPKVDEPKTDAQENESEVETKTEEPKKSKVKADKTTAKAPLKMDSEVNAIYDFKPEIEVDGVKYTLATGIKTIKDLREHMSQDDAPNVIMACHWNKSQIKFFGYFNSQVPVPKSFPNDLDLCSVIYVSDKDTVAYALSMYTEACICILPVDFEVFDDGARYCAGIDYQIYVEVK